MIKTFIAIAWRNIGRNKYRSLITLSGISLGLASLIFIRAFIDGADSQMVENYTSFFSGHIQIHKKDFHKKMSLELSIENPLSIEKILKSNPNVKAYSERIKDYALISSAENSSGILLMGIDPFTEPQVTTLNRHIKKGKFLSKGKDNEIVIGKKLAENLNVDLNEKVVIMSQGYDGSMAAGAYRICGILDTGAEEIDKGIALITIKAAQELLVMDNKISEIAIRTKEAFTADEITQSIKEKLCLSCYEVLSWKEISPLTVQWLEFDRAFSNIILFIVLIVVAASILNTMLMSVMERIKEIGIMLALGTRPRNIVLMVGWESFFLGIIGTLIGTSIGSIMVYYFGKTGIDLSKFSHALEAYYTGSVIYPKIVVGYITLWVLIVLLTSIIASLYPAYKASRLKPVEALRF